MLTSGPHGGRDVPMDDLPPKRSKTMPPFVETLWFRCLRDDFEAFNRMTLNTNSTPWRGHPAGSWLFAIVKAVRRGTRWEITMRLDRSEPGHFIQDNGEDLEPVYDQSDFNAVEFCEEIKGPA